MAILDSCKAKNLVYGSFHPLQNPPMFSVSYPPSLSQVITAVTSTQACIWWMPFFCLQESTWGCRCCISRVLTSRRVWSGLRRDPWQLTTATPSSTYSSIHSDRDNTSTFNILKDVEEEEGKITRVKRDRDSGVTKAKVISPFLVILPPSIWLMLFQSGDKQK